MTVQATRILKEARPLFWPWCAVALAGAVPLVHPLDWTPLIYLVGFLAVPLLAALSLGTEFQDRTMSLLLSQPVGRMKIWREKLSLTAVVVLSSVLVFYLALRASSYRIGAPELAFAGAWLVSTVASATFWTLTARSTIGGVALTIAVQTFILMACNLAYWVYGAAYVPLENATAVATLAVALLCYAGMMLWLGARKLARFEAIGTLGGDDLLSAGQDVLHGTWADGWRCRPTGAVINLFRKEFRLLRPVWVIILVAAIAWSCLTLFGLLYEHAYSRNFETVVLSVTVISTLMIVVLAGSFSLGEEKNSGTHAWHLTLPASALLQWRIKLYVALFAGLAGAGLLPMMTIGRMQWEERWLIGVGLLTFVAFFCACAANGTVRASLWVIPVILALDFAGQLGAQAGRGIMGAFVSRFAPFADYKFAHAVVSHFSSGRLFYLTWVMFYGYNPFELSRLGDLNPWLGSDLKAQLALLWGPTLIVGIIQSYRQFRTPGQNRTLAVARSVLPLVAVTFLWPFFWSAFGGFIGAAWNQQWTVQNQTMQAIDKVESTAPTPDAAHPLLLTEEDLAKASYLSDTTRRWLRGARVTIVPLQPLPHLSSVMNGPVGIDDSHAWYLATIRLPGGSNCTTSFAWWPRKEPVRRTRYVICQ